MVTTARGTRDVPVMLFLRKRHPHPTDRLLPPEIACSAWPIRRGPTARGDSQQALRRLPVTQSNTAGATTRVGCPLARLGNLWGSRLDQTMPATDQATTARRGLLTFRASAAEQEQLRQFAADKGTTLSDLIRHGLQLQGFKPPQR